MFSTSETKTQEFIQKYKVALICWAIGSTFIYFDHLKNYPNSIIENYHLTDTNSYFDYVDAPEREMEAMKYAKANGTEYGAKMYLDMGFRFLKPVPNLFNFFYLLTKPILWAIYFFTFMDFIRWIKNRYFNKKNNKAEESNDEKNLL